MNQVWISPKESRRGTRELPRLTDSSTPARLPHTTRFDGNGA